MVHNLLLNSYPDTLILGKGRCKQPSINLWFCLSADIFVLRFSFDTFGFGSQFSFSGFIPYLTTACLRLKLCFMPVCWCFFSLCKKKI